MDKTKHLETVLESNKLKHVDDLLTKFKSKRNEVVEFIKSEYADDIYGILYAGSIAKHTAINIKFDLDTLVPFKRDSFSTLEDMFNDVFEKLEEEYTGCAVIKKQKVSIGIDFNTDDEGDDIYLDIVPGRELNLEQYEDDKKVNLYVSSRYGDIEEKQSLQTNLNAQVNHIKSKDDARRIIRLLKIWKVTNNESYKSFLIELLVIRAFNNKSISGNLWEQLKLVLQYIVDNVSNDSFKLVDPGNSNNNVMDTLNSSEKIWFADKATRIVDRILEDDENIKTYFPINKEFDSDDGNKNAYGITGSVITPSIPSKNERFG